MDIFWNYTIQNELNSYTVCNSVLVVSTLDFQSLCQWFGPGL